ncbi:hypothetical protein Mycch_4590 [Mycolicibacterium chubuense NBB4]|uniref:Uncharacterized protein n=1 Tax=Mycolicibacterium chubuense (strain NBB4) TaxID=710421 RepID=I4BPT5_MYCCN|nr:hypothetical protein Mycch_4590 [Mycolicibacterium chubuense NBB4]
MRHRRLTTRLVNLLYLAVGALIFLIVLTNGTLW